MCRAAQEARVSLAGQRSPLSLLISQRLCWMPPAYSLVIGAALGEEEALGHDELDVGHAGGRAEVPPVLNGVGEVRRRGARDGEATADDVSPLLGVSVSASATDGVPSASLCLPLCPPCCLSYPLA